MKCLAFKSPKRRRNSCRLILKRKVPKVCLLRRRIKSPVSRKWWIRRYKAAWRKSNRPTPSIKNWTKSIYSTRLIMRKIWLYANKEMSSWHRNFPNWAEKSRLGHRKTCKTSINRELLKWRKISKNTNSNQFLTKPNFN